MASKNTKLKQQAPEFAVPQSEDEANDAIYRIGELQRQVQVLEAEMNEKLAAIKAEYELLAQPHQEEVESLAKGVQVYCDAHRDELTKGKVKFYKFVAGEVIWRLGTAKVMLKKGISEETILGLLRGMKRDEYIRKVEELNKQAILDDDEVKTALAEQPFEPGQVKKVTVAGIKELTVQQSETFSIVPFSSKLEAKV